MLVLLMISVRPGGSPLAKREGPPRGARGQVALCRTPLQGHPALRTSSARFLSILRSMSRTRPARRVASIPPSAHNRLNQVRRRSGRDNRALVLYRALSHVVHVAQGPQPGPVSCMIPPCPQPAAIDREAMQRAPGRTPIRRGHERMSGFEGRCRCPDTRPRSTTTGRRPSKPCLARSRS